MLTFAAFEAVLHYSKMVRHWQGDSSQKLRRLNLIGYTFQSGIEDAVIRNIQAVSQITEIVRTSFGPNGRNKMVINVGCFQHKHNDFAPDFHCILPVPSIWIAYSSQMMQLLYYGN